MAHRGLLYHIVTALILIYPTWKIFERAGLNAALSVFIFLPGIGWWIAGAILAFSRWPRIDRSGSGGQNA